MVLVSTHIFPIFDSWFCFSLTSALSHVQHPAFFEHTLNLTYFHFHFFFFISSHLPSHFFQQPPKMFSLTYTTIPRDHHPLECCPPPVLSCGGSALAECHHSSRKRCPSGSLQLSLLHFHCMVAVSIFITRVYPQLYLSISFEKH